MSANDTYTLLQQCEKQAEKLTKMELDDAFFEELDIFDNYFEQLKQVIENAGGIDAKLTAQLRAHMATFAAKMAQGQADIMSKIKTTGVSRTTNAYGAQKPAASKFEEWS